MCFSALSRHAVLLQCRDGPWSLFGTALNLEEFLKLLDPALFNLKDTIKCLRLCFPSNLKYWTTNSKLVCLHTNVIAMLNHNCSAAPIMHLFDVNERRKTQAFVFWKMCFVRLCTLLNLNYGLSSVKSDRLNKHKNLFRSVQKLSDGVWMLIKHPWRLLVPLKSASEPFWSLQRPSLEHLGHSWQLLGGFWDSQNRSLALFEGSWMRQSYLGRLFGPQNEHQNPVPRKKN